MIPLQHPDRVRPPRLAGQRELLFLDFLDDYASEHGLSFSYSMGELACYMYRPDKTLHALVTYCWNSDRITVEHPHTSQAQSISLTSPT
ncbi:hypothetical protein VRRI112168_00320 [Vreelandella rituensis]|uniref:Uncharacterized protein n=1 Tax=Vreelandella rituensis TaxID=2282306 RepID=A0A368UB85_9GAMM|nr:hypothetical protein [Halomonas rituensis]RCV93857.1 hypothetical protein DU506_01485 [Halomonas rituensis]